MLRIVRLAAVLLPAALTGCASIVTGQNQALSVETRAVDGGAVPGANCKLMNDKGTWFVTSPGSVTVSRSYNDLNITCAKDGHAPGLVTARSSTKAMAAGNLIFGGIIGAAVDAGTGAAFDYPSLVQVIMGRSASVGGREPDGKRD